MTPESRLRDLVVEELEEFLRELKRASHGRDRSVHKARKLLQQLRAAVMLFRPGAPELAKAENEDIRSLRRKLGPLRDAAARAETLRLLATRKRWNLWRQTLRRLASAQLEIHAKAWSSRDEASPFWKQVFVRAEALKARAQAWPYELVDTASAERVLKRAGNNLREALEDGIGHYGREPRHALRRKLRRYANLRRVVGKVFAREDGQLEGLLSLAKRCGHEGDLWMASQSAKHAASEDPEYRELALDLDSHRRRICGRHDASLSRVHADLAGSTPAPG